jgi:hypothetical protein
VALLEAGGPEPTGAQYPGSYFAYSKPSPESEINWNFQTELQANACLARSGKNCVYPRGMSDTVIKEFYGAEPILRTQQSSRQYTSNILEYIN